MAQVIAQGQPNNRKTNTKGPPKFSQKVTAKYKQGNRLKLLFLRNGDEYLLLALHGSVAALTGIQYCISGGGHGLVHFEILVIPKGITFPINLTIVLMCTLKINPHKLSTILLTT